MAAGSTRRSPLLIPLLVALVLATGCSAATPTVVAPSATASPDHLVSPREFSTALSTGERFVVNVHTPDEGSIPGTTAMIPFDQLTNRAAELPQERSIALAVYCKTGRMSAQAVTTLTALGYRDIIELRGGMAAWVAEGRPLAPPSP